MSNKLIARLKRTNFNVIGDTVVIGLQCRSDYEAIILFEDIVQRYNSGETLALGNQESAFEKRAV